MTVTPAELLILANNYSGFSESDLTNYIRPVVHDLEREGIFIEKTENITTVAGTRSYALSGCTYSYRRPFHLQPYDGTYYYDEMDEIDYQEYRDRLVNNSGNTRPKVFAVFNDTIYVDPPPSSTYAYLSIWGPINHGDTVTSISYDERFRHVMALGSAYYIFERYGLKDDPKAQSFRNDYEIEIQRLVQRKNQEKHHHVKTKDLG